MSFLAQNGGTILLSVLLIAVVCLIVGRLIRKKRRGESTCGCGCSNCAAAETCHPKI